MAEELTEKWVNLEDIAEHLSLSTDTVRGWIKNGTIPVYRIGRMYKFRISEVDAWVRSKALQDSTKEGSNV